jgi:hypothetical protein
VREKVFADVRKIGNIFRADVLPEQIFFDSCSVILFVLPQLMTQETQLGSVGGSMKILACAKRPHARERRVVPLRCARHLVALQKDER